MLSHFHSDHTGGLLLFREHFRGANENALSKVYVASGFFDQRQTDAGDFVGPGNFSRAQDFARLRRRGLFLLRSRPQHRSRQALKPARYQGGGDHNGPQGLFITSKGQSEPDIIMDDQSMGYLTEQGWPMTSGCATWFDKYGESLKSHRGRADLLDRRRVSPVAG